MPDAGGPREWTNQAPRMAARLPRVHTYDLAYVNALWHFDFHEGKRSVLTATGEWKRPYLFGMLDDCSCCAATRNGIW